MKVRTNEVRIFRVASVDARGDGITEDQARRVLVARLKENKEASPILVDTKVELHDDCKDYLFHVWLAEKAVEI